jgi:hypothetical protein
VRVDTCSGTPCDDVSSPCLCFKFPQRIYSQVRVDDSHLNSTGWVNISIVNASNTGKETVCGDGGVGCVPFSVFFTLDGSTPNVSSPVLCSWEDISREDVCLQSWKSRMPLQIAGAVLLRILGNVGFHEKC